MDQISPLRLCRPSCIIFSQRFWLWHPAVPLSMRLACSYTTGGPTGCPGVCSPPPTLRQSPPPQPEVWNRSDPSFLSRLLRDETATKRIRNSQCPTVNRHQLRSIRGLLASEQVLFHVYCGMGPPWGRGWKWAAVEQCPVRRLTDPVLLLPCCTYAVIPSLGGPWQGRGGMPSTLTLFLGKCKMCLPLGRDPVPGFIAGGWISPSLRLLGAARTCPHLPVALCLQPRL